MHDAWADDKEQCVSELCVRLKAWTFTSLGGRVTGDLDGTRPEQGKSQPLPRSPLSHSEQFPWGRKAAAICLGSAYACKIPSSQSCTHPIWHGCAAVTAEGTRDSKKSAFSSHSVTSLVSTCPCSLMLLKTKYNMKGCSNVHLGMFVCLQSVELFFI